MRLGRTATATALVGGLALIAALAPVGCAPRPPDRPAVIRLTDRLDLKLVSSTAARAVPIPRTEWRFDGPEATPKPPAFPATRGWEAGPGVADVSIRDGLLAGRTTDAVPILHIERTSGLGNPDQIAALEIRLRVSGGANLFAITRATPTVDLAQEPGLASRLPWLITTPIVAGDQMQTYTITFPTPVSGPRARHLLIRPTDVAGATFAIESVRLVFRNERLAEVPSGLAWQGLGDVYRETLVSRSPERIRYALSLPSRPLLDLAIGTPEDAAVTFKVGVRPDGASEDAVVLEQTVTTPHRWERRVVDLADFADRSVSLSLSLASEKPGTIGFWGAPAVRERVATGAEAARRPQGVILIQGDTLRIDHLDMYGYKRATAPTLKRLAGEGTLFLNAISQTGWTKASTSAVMTSLYPSTHGVHQIPDRLPASATTVAEVFRQAGYATVSFSSVAFTGQVTNLHQGFEELHESESTVGRAGPLGSKTAREYVDRLVEWVEDHLDVPFFVYLHVFDPHSPYQPNRPYDTMWAPPSQVDEYPRQLDRLRKVIADPFLSRQGMATREEVVKAGLDPDAFIQASKAWYDGSIRGMDTEIARLVERLRTLGLGSRTLVAFYADHGEEFQDHGRMWHGQSVYGEMIRVPLLFWWPDGVRRGARLAEPAQLIDIMPTLIEVSGLHAPTGIQGQSLASLITVSDRGTAEAGPGLRRRPVISEKQPLDGTSHPNMTEAYAIIDGNWKLIRNVVRPPEKTEFELYDFFKDPLDQTNLADRHPDVVERLAKVLDGWKKGATAARLKPDAETTKALTKEQLERLRSLGSVR
jgi:arylsulfatase A-like enzyme